MLVISSNFLLLFYEVYRGLVLFDTISTYWQNNIKGYKQERIVPRVLYKVSRGLDVAYIASEAIRHIISTYILQYDAVGYHGVIGKQLILDRGSITRY